jgi:predicted DsbA family dithiol-disulfide isomerase
VREYLLRHAEKLGLALQFPDSIPKTHKAMLMAETARDEGRYEELQDAIFRAYWGDGDDIGDESVLLRIATGAGLDPEVVTAAWVEGGYEERLHAFRHLALDLGVDSTPSALVCNELMIGARPYGVIRDAVERCLLTSESVDADEEAVES